MSTIVRLLIAVIYLSVTVASKVDNWGNDAPDCPYRCSRIYQRSLGQINENVATLQNLFESQQPHNVVKDVCWKSYDFVDCLEHCEQQSKQRVAVIKKVVKEKCRDFVKGNESNLACISRFHTFATMRCSFYLKEATSHQQYPSSMQKTCQYMYYHSLCLVNTIYNYCPGAIRLFTSENLRNYFLSFLLPGNDQQISEDLFDECQFSDYGRRLHRYQHTTSNQPVARPTQVYKRAPVDEDWLPYPDIEIVFETSSLELESVVTPAPHKRLFSPENDFIDLPPNFFYSSLRFMSQRPKENVQGDFYRNQESRANRLSENIQGSVHSELESFEDRIEQNSIPSDAEVTVGPTIWEHHQQNQVSVTTESSERSSHPLKTTASQAKNNWKEGNLTPKRLRVPINNKDERVEAHGNIRNERERISGPYSTSPSYVDKTSAVDTTVMTEPTERTVRIFRVFPLPTFITSTIPSIARFEEKSSQIRKVAIDVEQFQPKEADRIDNIQLTATEASEPNVTKNTAGRHIIHSQLQVDTEQHIAEMRPIQETKERNTEVTASREAKINDIIENPEGVHLTFIYMILVMIALVASTVLLASIALRHSF